MEITDAFTVQNHYSLILLLISFSKRHLVGLRGTQLQKAANCKRCVQTTHLSSPYPLLHVVSVPLEKGRMIPLLQTELAGVMC